MIHGFSNRAAVAIGTPAAWMGIDPRGSILANAVSQDGESALVLGCRRPAGDGPGPALGLLGHEGIASERESADLLVHCSGPIAWWSGPVFNAVVAVVTAEDEVHSLEPSTGDTVRSEPLRDGDRLVVLSRSISDSVPDLSAALEMALADDPSPSAACAWLLDAADGEGATSDMFVGILRHGDSAGS